MSKFDANEWWDSLDKDWKEAIQKFSGTKETPDSSDFKKILNSEKLFVKVSNDDISFLKPLKNIKTIGLKNVTEAFDYSQLTDFTKIESLKLEGVIKNISPLKLLKYLKKLDLYETKVLGLESFKVLNQVENLDLYGAGITELESIKSMKKLKKLRISNCPDLIDISPLQNLPKLESLDIGYTSVIDLSPVFKMKKLKKLYLEGMDRAGTSPSPKKIKEQIKKLEKMKPDIYISTSE